jgi:FtsP/CotA-like multicopper oxidase with cupredoxin domain
VRLTLAVGLTTLFVAALPARSGAPIGTALPKIAFNDNLVPAGVMSDSVLALDLEVVRGHWYLLGDDERPGQIYAFAERGRAPEIPGPLIRVPVGTEISVTITNPTDSTLHVHGLSARRTGLLDVVRVPPGETREVRFPADVEGTYHYWAALSDISIGERIFDDSQLGGALIIDPPGSVADDRIMVMGTWSDGRPEDDLGAGAAAFLVINGRPWPYTERLSYDMGDTVRWRIINASERGHPMHLHGFFFRVDSRGDVARDTIYWDSQRRMAVTENMAAGTTMSMVWSPDRPGGWLFHCHITWHVMPNASTEPDRQTGVAFVMPLLQEAHLGHDANRHVVEGMGGLMMGIYVRPPEGWVLNEPARRQMHLFVQSAPAEALTGRQFSYVLQEGVERPEPDSVRLPSSTIVLRKGEPTSIWVHNRLDEPTVVHWHGLEIDSYFDGVPGVGGHEGRPAPAILPGDSFEMRITPPRAGSFMYHTHVSDLRQQGSGLYGAFVVLEEDEEWDPDTDRIFLFGYMPPTMETFGRVAMNGTWEPDTAEFRVGTTYRLRFMNITLDRGGTRARLVRDGHPVRWTPIAKDGFDLPEHQRRPVFADHPVVVGETADYRYTPRQPGEMRVELRSGGGRLLVEQVIRVVADSATATDGGD